VAISFVGLLVVSVFALTAAPVAAQSNTTATNTATATATDTATATAEQCQGTPQMSRRSIALLDDTITAERGATVEANFRPEPTLPEECTIVVDLEFSFAQSGFQFGGGTNWDQATTNLVVGQFEVRPGEIRDIRAQVYTNGAEPGDQVTMVADYELWYKGDRDNSVAVTGVRKTIDVEAVNTAAQTATSGDSEQESDDQNTAAQTPAATETGGELTGLLGVVSENLGLFMVFILGLVSTVGLIYREPIINIMTGGN